MNEAIATVHRPYPQTVCRDCCHDPEAVVVLHEPTGHAAMYCAHNRAGAIYTGVLVHVLWPVSLEFFEGFARRSVTDLARIAAGGNPSERLS